MNKHWLWLALAALTVCACTNRQSQPKEATPIRVSVMNVGAADGRSERTYVGAVESETAINLTFTFGGELTGVYKHDGETVRKGDIIATIDPTTARAMHETALATLRQAEDGYARLQKLHEAGGLSEVKWVEMETNLSKAREAEISARKRLDDCTMRAPQSGVLSIQHELSVGSHVGALTTYAKIVDINNLRVSFSVPEYEIGLLNIGDELEACYGIEQELSGRIKVTEKSFMGSSVAHNYRVRAAIIDTHLSQWAEKGTRTGEAPRLFPGMTARVTTSVTGYIGTRIPSNCLITNKGGMQVWVINEDSIAERRYVDINEYVGNDVLVSGGLEGTERIVTEGYQKLYTGCKVVW